MDYNLKAIEKFSFFGDIKVMIMTALAMVGVDFKDKNAAEKKVAEDVSKAADGDGEAAEAVPSEDEPPEKVSETV